jgi:DNA mismatch repair protein MutS2
VKIGANRPALDDAPCFELFGARHPLLVLKFGSIDKVVPLNLRIDQDRRAILVTGPNTGGKTIALKTVGLLVLMAQSGLLIPADESSTIGLFHQVYADIGDEQSIEMSLSTFSSHIKNICQAVVHVSPSTLVLLDEIGAGTDPKEGAALAEAVILYMVDKGARLIATTHYSQLKTLALDKPEIENASLEFDRETLAPTFRLQIGLPGSSYAVEIAGRLGMPESICEQAFTLLGTGERSLAELIASVETELVQIRQDKARLTDRLAKAEELEQYYRAQAEKFKSQIDETRREALEETNRILDSTRRETERLVAEIRKTQADQSAVRRMHRFLKEQKQTADNIRSRLERDTPAPEEPGKFEAGDSVRIISLNQEGEIQGLLDDDRARVRVGAMTTIVELRNLEKIAPIPSRTHRRSFGSSPEVDDVSPEIHLRGMTIEEATETLDKSLDRALVAGLHQVYVIHGKGTGTLRRFLTEYLKKHPDVDSLRLGDWNEGGAGVTIVKLKS